MKHNYIIVDDSHESILNTQAIAMRFQNLAFAGYANNYDAAINLILEHQPSLIFIEINPSNKESNLSLSLINELHRYLTVVPKIIVTSKDQSLVFRAMEYGVADYLTKPLDLNAFRKAIFKFDKSVSQYIVPNPAVQQQIVPQQALTFSDFLRQEPIVKPIVEEVIEAKKEETSNAEEIIVDSPIFETVENQSPTSNEIEDLIDEKNLEIEPTISEEEVTTDTSSIEEEDTAENETPEESNDDATEIVTSAEEIESIVEEEVADEEENTTEESVDPVNVEESESVDEIISEKEEEEEEENNDEETITILPGQKVIVAQEDPLIICVKSYGDYRYIDSRDIIYFEADNNSVDIHLKDGEMVTAFKTLKAFESVLPSTQFLRIHNSYIINVTQVARIHTGNNLCYIKNSTIKLPFSKSYKENVELIIHRIASGNYLEI